LRCRKGCAPDGTRRIPASRFRTVRADRPFLLFLVAVVLAGFVYFQSSAAFPLHVRDSGLPTSVYGVLIGLNAALIVILELPVVRFVRRFPVPRAIAAGILLSGIGFA
jgi:hypothetical protein